MEYYIENGVRRAVAAREAGLAKVLAILYEAGQPPVQVLVSLNDLHSPKPGISRSDGRYLRALQGMTSPQGRMHIPPIEIQPLGAAGQKATVPLSQVRLDP